MPRRTPRNLTARLLVAVLAAVLVMAGTTQLATASSAEPGAAAKAAKKKGKAKRCGKGKKLVTVKVKRNGKRVSVKKCKKKAPKGGGGTGGGGTGGGPAPLFEPPGSRLEGEATRPFLQRYLVNSRFTDCPAGWPNCAVEERYSHFSDGSFYYCRLTPTSGSDIRFGSDYTVQNAVVEADGSWTFNEVVPSGGNPSVYEWHVATNGAVTGVYQFPGNSPQQLGPFQYVQGPLDCSY